MAWPKTSSPLTYVGDPPTTFGARPAAPIEAGETAWEQPNVLLITIDTLRADHLSAYGYARATTPNFDQLAAAGVLFRRAVTQFSQTNPSHATIMTGDYAVTHGLRWHGSDKLKEDVPTLAQVLGAAGYRTGAVISWPTLGGEVSGLDRGFRSMDLEVVPASPVDQAVTEAGLHSQVDGRANVTSDAAIEWLRANAAHPFFLWVHYQDPHFPYAPPPPFDRRFGTPCDTCPDGSMRTMYDIAAGHAPDATGTQHLVDLYDGEIAFTDQEIGRLLRVLDELGKGASTLVMLTGDHGESFSEHGEWSHPWILHDTVTHVPLIMKLPSAIPPGTVVSDVAQLADMMPTIMELTGVPNAPQTEGRSLMPLVSGTPERGARFAVTETVDFGNMAVVKGRFKIIKDMKTGSVVLFDLENDPQESTDVSDGQPDIVADMVSILDAWMAGHGVAPPG